MVGLAVEAEFSCGWQDRAACRIMRFVDDRAVSSAAGRDLDVATHDVGCGDRSPDLAFGRARRLTCRRAVAAGRAPFLRRVAGAFVLAGVLAGCGGAAASKAAPPVSAGRTAPGPGRVPVPSPATQEDLPAVRMPTGPPARFTVARQTSAGPILLTRLKGARSGVTGKVWVWLPPQYNDLRYATTGFPVVVLFTGGTGAGYNYWGNPAVLPTQAVDLALLKAGKAYPFIMVMPVLQMSDREDTECSDIPGRPKMGTWLEEDVPAFVRANFRTLGSRDGWGTAGASSGAFCSVKLAVDHPDELRAVVSWGGYFSPETDLAWSEQGRRANSPELILQRTRPDIRLLLIAPGAPHFRHDVDDMTALLKRIRPPTVATSYVQPNGGHYTKDLKKLLPRILEFLTANMNGPAAR